jgi:hypothetical protein
MEHESHTEENSKSNFNSASFQNLRLHNLWIDANTHKRRSRYSDWNGDLDTIWCELGGDVQEGDTNDLKMKDINKSMLKVGTIINWQSSIGFKKIDNKSQIAKLKQYNKLIEKEIFLRRLQNKQGKGTSYEDNASDYLDG